MIVLLNACPPASHKRTLPSKGHGEETVATNVWARLFDRIVQGNHMYGF